MSASSPPPESVESRLERALAENATLKAENAALKAENVELRELRPQLVAALETIALLERQVLGLTKKVMGRTSERTAVTSRRVSDPRDKNDEEAQDKRQSNRTTRDSKAPVEDVRHVLDEQKLEECEMCGSPDVKPMAPDPPSTEWEYVPGRLVRRRHHRAKAICPHCNHIVRADPPARVFDGSIYGPGVIAATIVRKILDCLPLYRQAKIWRREGCPIPRSTMKDHFHAAAELLKPVYDELVAVVVAATVVFADETSLKMQKESKTGFIWTFAAEQAVIYRYAASRSGQTPVELLGESTGTIVVDGYSGYNQICTPEGWTRAGCNAHSRRKFVDIDDPGAEHIVELYKTVWIVEREAKSRDIVGTDEHLRLRRNRAGPAMDTIKAWCDEHRDNYVPKSPVGQAITYVINQWEDLTRFLDDVRIPPDNNFSERLLRIIALGRKNYLFVGHEHAGQNLAMLASLVVTCELHDINPHDYLADILLRIQAHPASDVRSLLPDVWKTRFAKGDDHVEDETAEP